LTRAVSSVGLWLAEPTAHRGERLSPFFVYFLKSKKDGSHYIGQTNNIEKRLLRHNRGSIKTTKSKTPFEIIYFEEFNTRHEAMLREKYLKSIGGVKEKKAIIDRFF
jgi:putative endonuclease